MVAKGKSTTMPPTMEKEERPKGRQSHCYYDLENLDGMPTLLPSRQEESRSMIEQWLTNLLSRVYGNFPKFHTMFVAKTEAPFLITTSPRMKLLFVAVVMK